jgi:hypothetical protein
MRDSQVEKGLLVTYEGEYYTVQRQAYKLSRDKNWILKKINVPYETVVAHCKDFEPAPIKLGEKIFIGKIAPPGAAAGFPALTIMPEKIAGMQN